MSNLQSILDKQLADEIEQPEIKEVESEEEDEPETTEETSEEESTEEEETGEEDPNLLTEEYYNDAFVEVNGEKINIGELRNGYLRQSDYTKKTTEVAQLRKEAEQIASEAQAKAQQIVQQRFELVALDVEKKLKQYNNIDWKRLAHEDANTYTSLKADYDELIREANTLQSEYYSIQQQKNEQFQKQKDEEAKETFRTLHTEIPNFTKDTYIQMLDYAIRNGMKQDVVENLTDAASLRMIYKALQFDNKKSELKNNVVKSEKPSVKSKLRSKARVDFSADEQSKKDVGKIKERLSTTSDKLERAELETNLVMKALNLK